MGHMATEGAPFETASHTYSFAPEDVTPVDDCVTHGGASAIYDPATDTVVEQPATVTETTQPSTTTTTRERTSRPAGGAEV